MIQKEMQYHKEMLDEKPLSYMTFSAEARDDKELAKYALDKNPFNMWYISDRLKNDKDYAMEVLSTYPTFHLNKLSEKLQNDKEMVMFAMKRNQTYDLADLEHTCKRFINDKEVMDLAMERLNDNPMLVPGEIQIARAMVAGFMGKDKALEEVNNDPGIYRLLREEFKTDERIAMEAIKGDPSLINEVPRDLQNNKFYANAIMSVPEAENELPLRTRQEVRKTMETIEKPSLGGLIADAKMQAAQKNKNAAKGAVSKDER